MGTVRRRDMATRTGDGARHAAVMRARRGWNGVAPTFEFALNVRTARGPGVTIPPATLAIADDEVK